MAVVSIAITVSFHLKNEPSPLELRMAKPLGTIFWALSVMTLFAGVGNYISKSIAFSFYLSTSTRRFAQEEGKCILMRFIATVNQYSKRAAIVQIGWKTHAVGSLASLVQLARCCQDFG